MNVNMPRKSYYWLHNRSRWCAPMYPKARTQNHSPPIVSMHIRLGSGDAPWGLVLSKDGLRPVVEPMGSSAALRARCRVSRAPDPPGLKRSCCCCPGTFLASQNVGGHLLHLSLCRIRPAGTHPPPPLLKGSVDLDSTSSPDWLVTFRHRVGLIVNECS